MKKGGKGGEGEGGSGGGGGRGHIITRVYLYSMEYK